jgi:hypothetical protein
MGVVKLDNDSDGKFHSFSPFASTSRLFCAQRRAYKHIAHQRIHTGAHSVLHVRKINSFMRCYLSE